MCYNVVVSIEMRCMLCELELDAPFELYAPRVAGTCHTPERIKENQRSISNNKLLERSSISSYD